MKQYQRQNGFCPYCFKRMDPWVAKKLPSGRWDNGFTQDHVRPISKGGAKGQHNVLLCHLKCNSAKGNREPDARMLGYLTMLRSYQDVPLN